MLYFAYGSNMSRTRLQRRVPTATMVAKGSLPSGYKLCFHKVGQDGSGKCDFIFTGEAADCVEGALFALGEGGFAALDRFEGTGYDRTKILVTSCCGETVEAITYRANITDPSLKPFDWYKQHVLNGAVECGLSESYINMIKAIPSMPDPDVSRRKRELEIHGFA